MELERGKIGYSQLVLLMMGYIIGPSIILVPGTKANQDAWIAILLSIFEGIFLFAIGIILSVRFKGKNLVQIIEIVYGKYFSKIISVVYLWFLFHVGSLVLTMFKDFFMITTLPRTPEVVIIITTILVCAYAVKNGVEVIARCGQILVTLAMLSFFASSLLLLKNFDVGNLFPILEVPLKKLLIEVHGSATFLYGDTIVFLMILPYLNFKNKSDCLIYKSVGIAFVLGGLFIVTMCMRNIGVLGPMNGIYLYPTFQADRLINIGNLLSRLEILTVIGFFTIGFLNLSILLYATVLGSAQMLGLRTYRSLILPIALLMAVIALTNFQNVTGNILFARQIYPIYSLPFQVGIPLLTLIIALIRKLPGD